MAGENTGKTPMKLIEGITKFVVSLKDWRNALLTVLALAGTGGGGLLWTQREKADVDAAACTVKVEQPEGSDFSSITYDYKNRSVAFTPASGEVVTVAFNQLSPLDRERAKKAEEDLPLDCRFVSKIGYE